jgi:hypothetical protein
MDKYDKKDIFQILCNVGWFREDFHKYYANVDLSLKKYIIENVKKSERLNIITAAMQHDDIELINILSTKILLNELYIINLTQIGKKCLIELFNQKLISSQKYFEDILTTDDRLSHWKQLYEFDNLIIGKNIELIMRAHQHRKTGANEVLWLSMQNVQFAYNIIHRIRKSTKMRIRTMIKYNIKHHKMDYPDYITKIYLKR